MRRELTEVCNDRYGVRREGVTGPDEREAVFTYGAPALKYGRGASDEIGNDLTQYGARRVLVITDPRVAATGWPRRIADRIAGYGPQAEIFDDVHVEPTDVSMQK